MRVGVIDIGSNSVLLLIAERVDTHWHILTDQAKITRLGEGFSPSQHLQPQAIERTLQAIETYIATCESMRVEQCFAIATAVAREAKNLDALLVPLRTQYPSLKVKVLSEQEEAELSFLSVAGDPLFRKRGRLAVIDVGGGSVEVGIGAHALEWSQSLPIGALRLRERFGENLEAIKAHLHPLLEPLQECPAPDVAVSIGGTGVNLALLAGGHREFVTQAVHGVSLSLGQLREWRDRLLWMPEPVRRVLPGVEPERAGILPIGAFVLEQIMNALYQDRVVVSIRGVRYGVLEQLDRFMG